MLQSAVTLHPGKQMLPPAWFLMQRFESPEADVPQSASVVHEAGEHQDSPMHLLPPQSTSVAHGTTRFEVEPPVPPELELPPVVPPPPVPPVVPPPEELEAPPESVQGKARQGRRGSTCPEEAPPESVPSLSITEGSAPTQATIKKEQHAPATNQVQRCSMI